MSPDSPEFPPYQPGQPVSNPPPQQPFPQQPQQPFPQQPQQGPPVRRGIPAWAIVAIVCGGGFFVLLCCGALLLPVVQAARETARRANCTSNMKQLAIALQNYHAANGSFPPAYTVDANGQPMHSWRALLLPYLEDARSAALAQQYKFDEPWNGPNNSRLATQMPDEFHCPSSNSPAGETSYLAVVGPETIWNGTTGTPIRAIIDGTSNTIAVVEATDSGINWLEPRDLSFDEAWLRGVNTGQIPGIASDHPIDAMAMFCDGSVRALPEDIPQETLRAMLTKDGKEVFELPDY